ncbi:MAG: hypothetical protein H6622_01485 [Halobacteriovoraceae bacterium]|nr:hypothetical protein [Halobacteriovoraceae bacterium]
MDSLTYEQKLKIFDAIPSARNFKLNNGMIIQSSNMGILFYYMDNQILLPFEFTDNYDPYEGKYTFNRHQLQYQYRFGEFVRFPKFIPLEGFPELVPGEGFPSSIFFILYNFKQFFGQKYGQWKTSPKSFNISVVNFISAVQMYYSDEFQLLLSSDIFSINDQEILSAVLHEPAIKTKINQYVQAAIKILGFKIKNYEVTSITFPDQYTTVQQGMFENNGVYRSNGASRFHSNTEKDLSDCIKKKFKTEKVDQIFYNIVYFVE